MPIREVSQTTVCSAHDELSRLHGALTTGRFRAQLTDVLPTPVADALIADLGGLQWDASRRSSQPSLEGWGEFEDAAWGE